MDERLEGFRAELDAIQDFYGFTILSMDAKRIHLLDVQHLEAKMCAKYVADNLTIKDIL